MKKSILLTAVFLITALTFTKGQRITTPRTPSPAAQVSQTIGISEVIINYSRPAVREREVWGTQLAHYGYINLGFGTATAAPWRAGANENTTITFSHDAMVEGKAIPAGTYGLFMGLHEDGKVDLIFSKNAESWGSYFYDESEDQLRVKVAMVDNPHTERLTYTFTDLDKTSATCALHWEKKSVPFKIEFAVDELVLANARNQLRNMTGFSWQGPASAAQYAIQNKVALEDAESWAAQAVALEANFQTLMLQSQAYTANGKDSDAEAKAEEALNHPTAGPNQYYSYGRQLINQDKDDAAMKVFTKLNKKWTDHWLAPHGMARAYSAKGEFKKALKYERIAISKCPESSKQFLEGFIVKLENGEDFN